MEVILVDIHCHRCNRSLAKIREVPESWEGDYTVLQCKCVRPSPRRIVPVLEKKGLESTSVGLSFEWADLRQHAERAWRTGKTIHLITST